MKKITFFCRLAAVLTAAALLSSCKSAETGTVASTSADVTSVQSDSSPVLRNWDHGAVLLESAPVTADTAAPVPDGIITVPDEKESEPANNADTTVPAPVTAASVTAAPAGTAAAAATTAKKAESAAPATKKAPAKKAPAKKTTTKK